ncbi:hypothetical protein QE152_g8437 [Popillia japonica]|uniref:Uncharacterized protein n=1 Tax=Popillia japonica TaxID=7064 RepID=A0AAW1MBS9_POPJA
MEIDNNLQQYKADVNQKENQLRRKREELRRKREELERKFQEVQDEEEILDVDKTTIAELEADSLQDQEDYNKCQEDVVLLRDAITEYGRIATAG